ncbi:MAG: hypothetical protein HYR67_16730 [Bacteroidetes bacterium]|nr:hypothetical protein [Bacteroidota bacterium]
MKNRTFLLSEDVLLILNNEEFWLKQDENINQKIFEMLGKAQFQLQELNENVKNKIYLFDKERKQEKALIQGIGSIIRFRIVQIYDIEITLTLGLSTMLRNVFSFSIDIYLRDKKRIPFPKPVVIYLAGLLILIKNLTPTLNSLIRADETKIRVSLMGGAKGVKSFLIEINKDYNNKFEILKALDY